MSKVEHPHVFAMRLVSKHFGLCSKVRGAAICERITIPTAMIDEIAARDVAIRAESAALLRVCGEALDETTRQLEAMNRSVAHAASLIEPISNSTTVRIHNNNEALAALREAGACNG